VPFANTQLQRFHIHGYDAMLNAILHTLTEGKKIEGRCTGKVNLIPLYANTGNFREYKRLFAEFGVPVTFWATSPTCSTPVRRHLSHLSGHQTGRCCRLHQWQGNPQPRSLLGCQDLLLAEDTIRQACAIPMPWDCQDDEFIKKIAELSGKPVPSRSKTSGESGGCMTIPISTCTARNCHLRRPGSVDRLCLLPPGMGAIRITSSAAREQESRERDSGAAGCLPVRQGCTFTWARTSGTCAAWS